MKDKRYRSFMTILYPEDETHECALQYIEEFYSEYAYILHDKDIDEKGEIKKPHYHVIIKVKNAMTISALAKELKIGENYITPTKKHIIHGLRYLVHADDEDKYQYSLDEVRGTLKKRLKKSLDADVDETDAVMKLLELINEQGYLRMSVFVKLIAESGLWAYYRRNAYTFNLLLSEHNYEYEEKKKRSLHNIYYRKLQKMKKLLIYMS